MISATLDSEAMGVGQRRQDAYAPHTDRGCEHAPANACGSALVHMGNGSRDRHIGNGSACHHAEGTASSAAAMMPIVEENQSHLSPASGDWLVTEHGKAHGRAQPASPARADTGVGGDSARDEQGASHEWLVSSVQLLVNDLMDEHIYGKSPQGVDLIAQAEGTDFSPPLHPIKDFHTPRTDITREKFSLAAVGITISMTDGESAKIISAVKGGASVAGVCECDELVVINGVDVSVAEVTGFDCVEICQQALRDGAGARGTITLGVRDFCTMQLKFVDVDVSGGCPAKRLLRERNSPAAHHFSPAAGPSVRSASPSFLGSASAQSHRRPSPLRGATATGSPEALRREPWGNANLDNCYLDNRLYVSDNRPYASDRYVSDNRPYASDPSRTYASRPSSLSPENWEEEVMERLHSTPTLSLGSGGLIPRSHSREHFFGSHSHDLHQIMMPTTEGESDGEGVGWTWSVPGQEFWRVTGLLLVLALGVMAYVRSVGEEEVLVRVISAIDSLEACVQTLPLCPCTYWIRGSIVTVPLCRVCKPKVLRYHNYNNVGLVSEKRGRGGSSGLGSVCDRRPSWLMGKCRRSTDTIKYLGSFGSYEECEAACLSYNVGRDRCRSLIYYAKTHKDRKARQTCFALTHTGWNKVREFGVTTGRVLGPLSHLQRGLQYVKQELRRRVLLNWWDTGSPIEVAMSMVLVVFGLSGIRRTTTVDSVGTADTD